MGPGRSCGLSLEPGAQQATGRMEHQYGGQQAAAQAVSGTVRNLYQSPKPCKAASHDDDDQGIPC